MPFNVAYSDGTDFKILSFPDCKSAHDWLHLQSQIRVEEEELFDYVRRVEGEYERMTAHERSFGNNWLEKVEQLRSLSRRFELEGLNSGVPQTIREAEQEYLALTRA